MAKFIVGTGCSWTTGSGAYPKNVWELYKGRVYRRGDNNILGPHERENNWVNVLARDHLKGYIPINLGKIGTGNRSAVKRLYLEKQVNWERDEGFVMLLLSGIDRFDFMTGPDSSYTMWPYDRSPIANSKRTILWNTYGEEVWTPEMAAMELFCNIREAEMFVSKTNFELVVANAFHRESIPKLIYDLLGAEYHDMINWDNFEQLNQPHCAFVYDFLEMDNAVSKSNWDNYHRLYVEMDWPQQYLTNDIHPTIDGNKYIAERFYNFIKDKV